MFCEEPKSVFVIVTAPVALLTPIPVPATLDVTPVFVSVISNGSVDAPLLVSVHDAVIPVPCVN